MVFLLLGDLIPQPCVLFQAFPELLLQDLTLIFLLLTDILELQSSLFNEIDHWHSLLHFPFDIKESFLELVFLILCGLKFSLELIDERGVL